MYKIRLYESHMLRDVADLMIPLYGNRLEPYLYWRYHDNPYTESPLSIVAFHGKKLVGFRGYLATKWLIEDQVLDIMCMGDTIVHKDHRRKGLSVQMGQVGFEQFSAFDIFMNFSATANAVPGYERLGFVPLVEKVPYFRRCEDYGAPNFTESFDNIYESTRLDTTGLVMAPRQQISVARDEDYLQWRFKNPRQRYHFYYHKVDGIVTDYVALSIREMGAGYIIDFTKNNSETLKSIIAYIIQCQRYEYLYVSKETIDLSIKEMGFCYHKDRHTVPVFVKANKWTVNNLDIRKVASWDLKTTYVDNM